jgi:DNA sulfur modification protein DndD
MIFEELVLHNFGIYKGRHVIKLAPPSRNKPIILIGGLNGSGKTTLLEALELILYGKFAKYSSNRGNINYVDYLQRMINYSVAANKGAALELQFTHFRDGKEESIRVHRSWQGTGKNIKETIEVQRDGMLDAVITERWYEYVEEFIPSRISSLFFFDGEKIEAFADQDKASNLLKTGIHALLGLDLVSRLSHDLSTLETKRRKVGLQTSYSEDFKSQEKYIEQLNQKIQKIVQQQTDGKKNIEKMQQEQAMLQEEYRREGGELFEQCDEIKRSLKSAQAQLAHTEEQLREIATGEAPLLLVIDLLRAAEEQAIREQEARRNQTVYEELKQRDATLLQLLKQHAVKNQVLTTVKQFIKADNQQREQFLTTECYLSISPKAFAQLQDGTMTHLRTTIRRLITQSQEINEKINDDERKLASIPDPESLAGINQRIDKVQKKIEQIKIRIGGISQEQSRLQHERKRKQGELSCAYEEQTQEHFLHETNVRVLKQIRKVRSTLEQFSIELTEKHIQRLESLIFDCFQHLLRKKTFVTRLEIDPIYYTLTLHTITQEKILPESLSAGERQLLAVSILWGLSRASGRPLPAIIDTPLSRLDGEHRQNLVDNYFHQASHQVILLSTDEEIDEKYYEYLKPAIGREYFISYEERQNSSVIKPGYFK